MKQTIKNLIRLVEYFGFDLLKTKGLKKTVEIAVDSRLMLDHLIDGGEKAAGLKGRDLGKGLKLPEILDHVAGYSSAGARAYPNAMYGCPRSRKMVLNRLVA
jgi:hypothetical protein